MIVFLRDTCFLLPLELVCVSFVHKCRNLWKNLLILVTVVAACTIELLSSVKVSVVIIVTVAVFHCSKYTRLTFARNVKTKLIPHINEVNKGPIKMLGYPSLCVKFTTSVLMTNRICDDAITIVHRRCNVIFSETASLIV